MRAEDNNRSPHIPNFFENHCRASSESPKGAPLHEEYSRLSGAGARQDRAHAAERARSDHEVDELRRTLKEMQRNADEALYREQQASRSRIAEMEEEMQFQNDQCMESQFMDGLVKQCQEERIVPTHRSMFQTYRVVPKMRP